MRRRPFLVVATTAALMAVSLPAQAAPAPVPVTCGMVVTESTDLYLANNLYCPSTDGVTILNPSAEDPDDAITVHVDLRGHTLRGTRSHQGVTGATNYPYRVTLVTTNGRVEGWQTGIVSSTTVAHVKMVDNIYGLVCEGSCSVAESYFNRNQEAGMLVSGETGARVTTSTFSSNGIGAYADGFASGLTVNRSVFARNATGVTLDLASYHSDLNSYRGNAVAIRVLQSDAPAGCFTSTRDLYVDNGAKVVGVIC